MKSTTAAITDPDRTVWTDEKVGEALEMLARQIMGAEKNVGEAGGRFYLADAPSVAVLVLLSLVAPHLLAAGSGC